jgi:hypothetical protein
MLGSHYACEFDDGEAHRGKPWQVRFLVEQSLTMRVCFWSKLRMAGWQDIHLFYTSCSQFYARLNIRLA